MKTPEEIFDEAIKANGLDTVSVKDSDLYEAGIDAIKQALSICEVSKQRELLFAYVTKDLKKPISDFNSEGFYKTIDKFLANNCC